MPRPKGTPKTGGKPKGYKSKATLTKEAARDAVRQIVLREMDAMLHAQIANAKGIHYLVVREKATGKFLRVSQGRAEKLKTDEEVIEIWEKDPAIQAFTDLMNRAIDKPAEQEQAVSHSGTLTVKWQS